YGRAVSEDIRQVVLPREVIRAPAPGRDRPGRMGAPARAWPAAEHLRHRAHRVRRRDVGVVGGPVVTYRLPPFPRLLPVDAALRVQVLPRLRRHHNRTLGPNALQKSLNDRLRPAADKAEAA